MNRKSIIGMAVIALTASLAASTLSAHPQEGRAAAQRMRQEAQHRGAGPFGRLERLSKVLDLSGEQEARIRDIFAQLKAQNAPYREQLQGMRGDAIETLIANPDDTDAAQAAMERKAGLQRNLQSNMLMATARALKVLTPAQRAKFATVIEERRNRREERRRG